MLLKSPSTLELDELELLELVVLVLLLTEETLIDLLPVPCEGGLMGHRPRNRKTAFNWFNGGVEKLGRYFFRKKCGFICLVFENGILFKINTRKLMQGKNCRLLDGWAFFAAVVLAGLQVKSTPAGGTKGNPGAVR
jgi:hypothetical protein